MAVFPNIPRQFYQCVDGAYSLHNRPGACSWHGGLSSGQPVPVGAGQGNAGVQLIPIDRIHIAREWFQNRAAPYSLRTVGNIVAAVQEGNFRWANMDAITLWRNPTNSKLYILSGHSRHEAFRQLCAGNLAAEGRDFCQIPAKIVAGISVQDAQKIALESNTLSTKETALERATFYRKQLEAGADTAKLRDLAKRLEGRNSTTILAYAQLNPSGKTWAALQALQNAEADSRQIIAAVGRWIGNARSRNSDLTNSHENELYDWLITSKGYGSGRGQISNEKRFRDVLDGLIQRRTTFGRLAERLNIQQHVQRSPVQRQYDERIEAAKAEVIKADQILKTKIRALTARGATDEDIARITEPLERQLRRARLDYQRLLQDADKVSEAASREINLFASVGRLYYRQKFLAI